MSRKFPSILLPVLLAFPLLLSSSPQKEGAPESRELTVLWTSGDREVALNMGLMYTGAAKSMKWWDKVTLIVWGPSQKLLVQDKAIQAEVRKMKKAGVKLQACIACASRYGVVKKLRALGVEVKPMGRPLTRALQGPGKVLSL